MSPPSAPSQPVRPVRLRITGMVDAAAVRRLQDRLRELGAPPRVRCELADIDGFDSTGLGALLSLQATFGDRRFQLAGLTEAAHRLLGRPATTDHPADRAGGPALIDLVDRADRVVVSWLRQVVVVRPLPGVGEAELDTALREVTTGSAGLVVVDLIDCPQPPPATPWLIADAAAALSRQRRLLLVVNAADPLVAALRRTGLPEGVRVARTTDGG